jgi:hypothetical protein
MPMDIEISLRVPNMKVRALDENGYPIDHSAVRFRKVLTVPAVPKPNDALPLDTRSGRTIDSRVVRTDWNEGKNLFVVSCQYANRSITPDEYSALRDDPDWVLTPLI